MEKIMNNISDSGVSTPSLKDLAIGAATSRTIPTPPPPPESEIPSEDDRMKHESDNLSSSVDAPVIITTPPNNVVTQNRNGDFADNVVPSSVGLNPDTLYSPKVDIDLNSNTLENKNDISNNDNRLMVELMPNISEDERIGIAKPIFSTREEIIKDLIINHGFTPDEAKIAAENQIKKKITDKYNELMSAKLPESGDVVIDKTDNPNDLGLTKEEHEKLERVKRVRLVVVEDVDLANIQIERPDEKYKADYISSIEGSLSRYAVPLPMFGDFVTFRGASMVQLVNVVNYEDASLDEIVSTKASLIYEKLVGGTVLKKFDSSGKNILSYNEFANKFPYQDIDMALYGILCASSMEENSTSLTCQSCSHQWMQNYNLKSLLKMDDMSDAYKERIDNILKYKSNDIAMSSLYDSRRKASRFKSPFTGNIYDLSYPSIARAVNLLKRIDVNDKVMSYFAAIAIYLSRILIYNGMKNTYVEITAEETPLLLDTMKSISNDDINLLAKQIRDDFVYTPQFALPASCPSCGKKSDIPINVDALIFLIARDSIVEIDT